MKVFQDTDDLSVDGAAPKTQFLVQDLFRAADTQVMNQVFRDHEFMRGIGREISACGQRQTVGLEVLVICKFDDGPHILTFCGVIETKVGPIVIFSCGRVGVKTYGLYAWHAHQAIPEIVDLAIAALSAGSGTVTMASLSKPIDAWLK